jgi:biotin carboxyl carrier protein
VEYKLEVAQKNMHAEVDVCEDRSLKISVDDRCYDVKYNVISDNLIHMSINSNGRFKQVNAYVADCAEGKSVVINGRHYLIRDLEAQGKRLRKGVTPDIPEQITPPMPAVVVRIPIQVGESVKKGQSVIVVSAMKMETTLCAPFDGKVARINVAVNEKVAPGQILVEIEKKGDTRK